MFSKTQVIEYGIPDISGSRWCKEGLVFQVIDGLGRVKHVCSKYDKDYWYYSQLRLNDIPIVQGYYPSCPTCYGMLATGYGIENVKCDELDAIRETLNQNYSGIKVAFSSLMPLLKLLNDGMYMLADVELAPTDGHHFFYNVPNDLTENSAACEEFYNPDYLSVTDGFPAFMYPTQSAKTIDDERVEEYKEKLKQGKELRGLAYREQGFVCALLDGHHKAIAAAQLGIKLKCLTIVPVDGCELENCRLYGELPHNQRTVNAFIFSGARIAAKPGCIYKDVFPSIRQESPICIERYRLTDKRFASMETSAVRAYNSVEHISFLDAAGIVDADITDEDIIQWISCPDDDGRTKLKYLLEYRALTDPDSAYCIAEAVIQSGNRNMPYREAWRALLQKKDHHTEEMAIEYIVDHTPQDECWDLVTAYWDSES